MMDNIDPAALSQDNNAWPHWWLCRQHLETHGVAIATCPAKIQDRRNYSDRLQRVLAAGVSQRSQSAHSTIEDPALQC